MFPADQPAAHHVANRLARLNERFSGILPRIYGIAMIAPQPAAVSARQSYSTKPSRSILPVSLCRDALSLALARATV